MYCTYAHTACSTYYTGMCGVIDAIILLHRVIGDHLVKQFADKLYNNFNQPSRGFKKGLTHHYNIYT